MGLTHVLPVDPSFVVELQLVRNVLITEFDSGQEQRKEKWAGTKRRYRLKTEAMNAAELESMRDFYEVRGGPFDVFIFLPPFNLDRLEKAVACGTGTGSQTVFNIQNSATPRRYMKVFTGAGTRNQAYVAGTPTAATFANDDTNKKSTITFGTAPANLAAITADVDRYIIGRFDKNEFTLALEHYAIGSAPEYEIVEVLRSSI